MCYKKSNLSFLLVCYTCPPRGWKERLSAESVLLVYIHKIKNMWQSKKMSLLCI
jgi:hypothetical protein